MSLVGYARVSSKGQSLDIQLNKLKKYGCTKIFKEKISGVDQNRPELIKCKAYLREGDSLVITKLDRMARSALDLGNIVKRFKDDGINLIVLDQNIDTTTSYGKLTFHILSSVAEFENEIRKERQLEGIERAMKQGVQFGRPPKMNQAMKKLLREDLKNNINTAEILKKRDISRAAFFKFKKELKLSDQV